MKLKASLHSGRGSAKHNDRKFDLDKAEHINQEKTKDNVYHICTKNEELKSKSFEEYEREFYSRTFKKACEAQNTRNEKARHPERNRTPEQWYQDKAKQPEETILQIGNKEWWESLSDTEQKEFMSHLEGVVKEWRKEVKEKYPQVRVLDYSIHVDEGSPHIHARRVFLGHDRDGNPTPNINKALEEMGIDPPDPTKKLSKYNNRKQTYTADERSMFYDIVERIYPDIEIDREPELKTQHLDTLKYKKEKIAEEIIENEQKKEKIQRETKELVSEYEQKKQSLIKEYDALKTEIEEKKAELKGEDLDYVQLEFLQEKKIWTKEDKDNILKTAFLKTDYQDQVEELKPEIDHLRAENKKLHEDLEFLPSRDQWKQKCEEARDYKQKYELAKTDLKNVMQEIKSRGIELKTTIQTKWEDFKRTIHFSH